MLLKTTKSIVENVLAPAICVFLAATIICASAAVTLAQSSGTGKRYARRLSEMGVAAAERWLELNRERNNEELWEELNSHGQRFYDIGDYERARVAHTNAIAAARARQDDVAVAESRHQLGRVIKGQGKLAEALNIYLTANATLASSKGRDQHYFAYLLKDIAIVYRDQYDFERGSYYAYESLKLGEQLKDQKVTGLSYLVLGSLYRNNADFPKAIPLLEKSRKIFAQLNEERYLVDVATNLGDIYSYKGDYTNSFLEYSTAERIAERIQLPYQQAWVYRSLGLYYGIQGDNESMRLYIDKSLRIAQKIGDRELELDNLHHLGMLAVWQTRYAEAVRLLTDELRTAISGGSDFRIFTASIGLGSAETRRGNYQAAQSHFDQALIKSKNISDKRSVISLYLLIAELKLKTGSVNEALNASRTAQKIASESEFYDLQLEAMSIQGESYFQSKQYERTRAALTEAIGLVENGRTEVVGDASATVGFLDERILPYEQMIALDMAEGKKHEALISAERAKARSLLNILELGQPNLNQAMSVEEKVRDKSLGERIAMIGLGLASAEAKKEPQEKLASLRDQLNSLQLEQMNLQNNVLAREKERQNRLAQNATFTSFEQLKSRLPDSDTLTLAYAVTPQQLYLFALTRDERGAGDEIDFRVFTIPVGSEELTKRVAEYRGVLTDDFTYTFRQTGREMYDLLIKPVESLLSGKKKLCLIPDGALWELPFEALVDPHDGFLIDRMPVYREPSLSVMIEHRRGAGTSSAARRRIMLLGAPQFPGDDASLRYARDEAAAISKVYGAENSVVLQGVNARKEPFLRAANKSPIIHFPTHGVYDQRRPLDSYLQLTPSPRDNGRLTGREISNLDLRTTNLAVLSACDTGRGRVTRGEGLLGLSWAFAAAGVKTVVASQWKVDSPSTALLMTEFHRQLLSADTAEPHGISPAVALRRAVLKHKQDGRYKLPYYWASFIVVGSDREP